MKAKLENVTIVNNEVRKNKNGDPYLLVTILDEDGLRQQLVDKKMSRASEYREGVKGNIVLEITSGSKYTTVRIDQFVKKAGTSA